ncbi:MAG: hypothetical protein K2L72_00015 [Clostridia bacterium]|nr:hypothetical protein [Clostridia bacterium]
MAKTQLRTPGNNARVIENDMDEKALEIRRENQMEAMDDKIETLARKAIEFYDLYGAEDYRYQMMVTFLDVAFQMKDAIGLITSVQVATSYLSTAIQFIDDSIDYEDAVNKQILSKSYGPFARLKRRIIMRRAQRNNRRRLDTAIKNIVARVEMAHDITDSLRTSFERMRASMAKADEKRRRKEAKRVEKGGAPLPNQDRALSYIAEVRGGKPTPPAAGSTPPAGASASPAPSAPEGGTTRDIDDIL